MTKCRFSHDVYFSFLGTGVHRGEVRLHDGLRPRLRGPRLHGHRLAGVAGAGRAGGGLGAGRGGGGEVGVEQLVEPVVQVGGVVFAHLLRALQVEVDLASQGAQEVDSLGVRLLGEVLVIHRADDVASLDPEQVNMASIMTYEKAPDFCPPVAS